ncbi:MAG: DEAD/DEAH box helicase [Pseudoscardovia radai]|nr:DEAD/DEAH box helicase [Pseudoscardovia radai]
MRRIAYQKVAERGRVIAWNGSGKGHSLAIGVSRDSRTRATLIHLSGLVPSDDSTDAGVRVATCLVSLTASVLGGVCTVIDTHCECRDFLTQKTARLKRAASRGTAGWDGDFDDADDDFSGTSAFGSKARHMMSSTDDQAGEDLHPVVCKHIAALSYWFMLRPRAFQVDDGDSPVPAPKTTPARRTSTDVRSMLIGEESRRTGARRKAREEAVRELDAICESTMDINDSDEEPAVVTAEKPKRRGAEPIVPTPGSVRLIPQVQQTSGGWELSARLTCGDANYVVPSLNRFVVAVRDCRFATYGKRLAFVHDRMLFDAPARAFLDYLARLRDTRIRVFTSGMYNADNYLLGFEKQAQLSDSELCELLDMFTPLPTGRVPADWAYMPVFSGGKTPFDLARDNEASNMAAIERQRDVAARADAPLPGHEIAVRLPDDSGGVTDIPIFEGDPALFFAVSVIDSHNAQVFVPQTRERIVDVEADHPLGVSIGGGAIVRSFVRGARSSYVLLASPQTDGQLAFFRCSPEFAAQHDVIEMMCGTERAYVESTDWPAFVSVVLPRLESAGMHITVPRLENPDATLRPQDPDVSFYLDRTDEGITCELVAGYPNGTVQLLPDQGTMHADREFDDPGRDLGRDRPAEKDAVDFVDRLFPDRNGQGIGFIEDRDDEQIMLLMRYGLKALHEYGTVYATPAFDGIVPRPSGAIRLGVTMRSNLLEVTPLADEIPSDEVAGVLASYRKKRRFHRLRNGDIIDLASQQTEEALGHLDEISDDIGLSASRLSSGAVDLPASQAFVLAAYGDEVEGDESFRAYVHDMDVIDPESYAVPEGLNGTMRPYQVEGFQWLQTLYDKGFGGILADEMGLGKTIQTLAMILARRGDGPALIVCPASLVYNWEAECRKFVPGLRVETAAGTKTQRRRVIDELQAAGAAHHDVSDDSADVAAIAVDGPDAAPVADANMPDIVITSYDLLRRDIEEYEGVHVNVMVLDEAQYIKNPGTKVAHAVKRIDSSHRFALTGTPIENRLSELWSIFDFLMPGLLRSYSSFRARYELPIAKAMEDGMNDCPEAARLQAIARVFIKRRLKSQVLKDLPERLETTVSVHLEGKQRTLYAAQERRLRDMLDGQSDDDESSAGIPVLAELTRLREICCDPRLVYDNAPASSAKLDAIVDIVGSSVDSGRRVLVFSQFTSFLDIIGHALDAADIAHESLVGSTPKKKRVELADAFNAGKGAAVMLVSLKAGNTGLNLVGASVVVHADPWWNSAAQDQATGRAHRIGQTRDVDVYQVIAADTVEERVHEMQERKGRLARTFTNPDASMADPAFGPMMPNDAVPGVGALTRGDVLRLLS